MSKTTSLKGHEGVTVRVINAQHEVPVNVARMARVARLASRQLPVRTRGRLEITFIDAPSMRRLNKQFLRHDRDTDVLSFRYDGEPTVGEILIAPSQARQYAARHGLSYPEELARYVIHGLLHWLGHDDATPQQQRKMRVMEERLLAQCFNNRAESTRLASRDISFSLSPRKGEKETSRTD